MPAASPFPILTGAERLARHPHEGFGEARALEARLRATIRGEVRFDDASRALYSMDSSNYRQVPIGLVIPRDAEDVVATVAACREFGATRASVLRHANSYETLANVAPQRPIDAVGYASVVVS